MTEVAIAPAIAPAPAPADSGAQSLTPEAARETIESRKSDREFGKRLLSADPEVKAAAQAEWTQLHKTAYPAPQQVASQDDVNAQEAARTAERWDTYIAMMKQHMNLNPQQEAEIRSGVVDEVSYRWAVEEKARLLKDRSFCRDVLDNKREAKQWWGGVIAILSLKPVRV
jgi:hypothetical protein